MTVTWASKLLGDSAIRMTEVTLVMAHEICHLHPKRHSKVTGVGFQTSLLCMNINATDPSMIFLLRIIMIIPSVTNK